MIKGIGVDIVKLQRFEKLINNEFVNRILTFEEKKIYDQRKTKRSKIEFLAGRFACKEAFVKAMGTGIGPIGFKDVEVLYSETNQPLIKYKNCIVHTSISHSIEDVVAFVVIEKK